MFADMNESEERVVAGRGPLLIVELVCHFCTNRFA